MDKRDFRRELRHLYSPSVREVVSVDVPPMNFLMIDGEGDPNTSPAYAEAVEALFAAAYALKFAVKKGSSAIDYGVMPLEGLWWADDMSSFTTVEKSDWKWTIMIMQPDPVGVDLVEQTLMALEHKKVLPALRALRFETFGEGLSAQVMHVGPFADEGPTIDRVHEFIRSSGHERFGRHHEIYLSDIRKAAPDKWKTVIRQPMR